MKTSKTKTGVSSIIYTALLVVAIFLVGWAFAPGHTNGDTISMLTQAKTGVFGDWHSQLVSGIWFLLGGQPWVVALTLFVTLGSFGFLTYKLFRLAGFAHSTACIFAFLTCYTPPVLGYLGCVCKDTWVAVLFLGILFLSIRYYERHRLRVVLLRNITCITAVLVRPDFIVIVGLFLVLEFLFLRESTLSLRLVRLMASGLVVLAGYFGADGAMRYLEHTVRSYPEQFLYLSELADLSVAENRALIPAPFLHGNDLATIKRHYRFQDPCPLFWGEPENEMIRFSNARQEISDLRREWIRELWNNPSRALRHRFEILAAYLCTPYYYQPGIETGIIDANTTGLFIYHKSANELLLKYLVFFTNSPFAAFFHSALQRHLISLLGCPILIALLLRYGPATICRRVLMVALVCAFFYQLLFSVLGFPPYFRFGYAGVMTFWIGVYVVVGDFVRLVIEKRSRRNAGAAVETAPRGLRQIPSLLPERSETERGGPEPGEPKSLI